MSWDLTSDVQQYVDHPETNFGWEIMDETMWGGGYVPATHFYSKEYTSSPPSYFPAFIFGSISHKVAEGNIITFNAVHTKVVYFFPLTVVTATTNQTITIKRLHFGVISGGFVCAFCEVSPIY
jgi:hypothetical protein